MSDYNNNKMFKSKSNVPEHEDGDTPNPKGGVRGVIPDKMSY